MIFKKKKKKKRLARSTEVSCTRAGPVNSFSKEKKMSNLSMGKREGVSRIPFRGKNKAVILQVTLGDMSLYKTV